MQEPGVSILLPRAGHRLGRERPKRAVGVGGLSAVVVVIVLLLSRYYNKRIKTERVQALTRDRKTFNVMRGGSRRSGGDPPPIDFSL